MSNSKNKKKNVTSPASARKMNDVESKISSKQLKPIFQKTQSGFEKVFMHASDMKQLSVRANDAIIVSGNQKNVMFNVWHRDDVPAGSIVIHPMWNAICAPSISGTSTISSPGGGGGVKHLTISTDLQNYYLYSCNSVSVNFTSDTVLTDTHKKMLRDSLFKAYVSSSIQNTYLPSGVCILSFTWNGVRYRFNVVTIDDCCSEVVERTTEEGEIEMGQVLDRRQCMYKITSHTVIYIGSEGENSVSSGDAPRRIAMTEESTIAEDNFYGFCGYCAQIEALLSYTVAHPVNSLCHSQTVASLIKKPKGILLYGPPGTGKTLLLDSFTRYIARINSSAHTYSVCEVNHHILLSGFVGDAERKLQEVFQGACSGGRAALNSYSTTDMKHTCFVLMDDIDVVCPSRSGMNTTDIQKRIVTSLLTLLDGVNQSNYGNGNTRVCLIATTNRPNVLDSALRRPGRLDVEIELPVPTPAMRESILVGLMKDMHILSSSNSELTELHVKQVAEKSHGMVGSDLLQICKMSIVKCFERRYQALGSAQSDKGGSLMQLMNNCHLTDQGNNSAFDSHEPVVCIDDVWKAASLITPSALREVAIEVPTVRWSDIGGMETVKQSLKEVVEWPLLYASLFASMGVACPRGVLLYGPPGCSKTLMAKAVATESSMNFLAVRGPELLSKYLGESEKAVQALFRRARSVAPSIVFFDEIDALAGARGSTNAGVNDRVLAQLLTELDGVQGSNGVIVIAATNRPDLLDPALMRPGRIDRKIYVPPPDNLSRKQIFQHYLGRIPCLLQSDDELSVEELHPDMIVIDELVNLTKGFSGAEVVACCTEGSILAITSDEEIAPALSDKLLRRGHLLEAISSIIPQISQDMLDFYQDFAMKNISK